MIYNRKLFKNIRNSCFGRVHIKFLYNSKFDFTAKSLVTNIVVIASVLCIIKYALFDEIFLRNALTDLLILDGSV